MLTRLKDWLGRKWQRRLDPFLVRSYEITFSTQHGRRVLQHLLDSIYCRTYEGTDPQAALVHNARRSVVQEILENIHMAEAPQDYETVVDEGKEGTHAA